METDKRLWRKYQHAFSTLVDDFINDPHIERAHKEDTLKHVLADINHWLTDRPLPDEDALEELLL